MHPDRKIGIAMGILLVGVVGALFFRNEPLDSDATLDAHREQELNQRLTDRDVALYAESGSQPEQQPVDDTHRRLDELLKERLTSDVSPPGIGSLPTDANPRDRGETHETQPPISFDPPSKSNPESVAINENAETDPSANAADAIEAIMQGASDEPRDLAEAQQFDEYTVQFGDTLSEIAEKFLGSQNKYRQIYEANRDRMKSPDHLKVGSAIRIPRVVH